MASCENYNNIFNCTLEICCREQGYVEYEPQLPATLAYLAIFAAFCVAQLGLGVWGKTWGFLVGMVCGLLLEVLGYVGRIMVRNNPFNLSIFLFYFIPLGLGPAFLTASIYLTLGRLVIIYSESFSRIQPRTYTLGFLTVDILSLCIQAVGGSICGAAMTDSFRQKGVNILITGLTLQALSLATFLSLCTEYAIRVRRHDKEERNEVFRELRGSMRFKLFLGAITLASITIFIRCVYRVIELAQGFSGAIANAEVPFLIFEGPMIMIAVLSLTVFHPALVFRGGYWKKAEWRLRTPHGKTAGSEDDFAGDSAVTGDRGNGEKKKTWFGGRRWKKSEQIGENPRSNGAHQKRLTSESSLESANTIAGNAVLEDEKMVEVS